MTSWKRFILTVLLATGFLTYPGSLRELHSQEGTLSIEINKGVPKFRVAIADFQARSPEDTVKGLTGEFNAVLFNDIDNAGLFDLVSKSFIPSHSPGTVSELNISDWTNPPVNADVLAFGNAKIEAGQLTVEAHLYDLKNPAAPSIIGRRYRADPTEANARAMAHQFADEIILRLSGGVRGIASTHIAYVHREGRSTEEIYICDYDGYNPHPMRVFNSLSLTPRWSPDNTKIAFTTYRLGNPDINIFSLETNALLSFPRFSGLNTTPAWSPDGEKIAFCSSMHGYPDIYVSDSHGRDLRRLTFSVHHGNNSPVWNPVTGSQIAFVSDRSGIAQLYVMDADGSNVQRLVSEGGWVDAPSWSPDGQFIAFMWKRKSEGGNFDIYILELASRHWIQLTQDQGQNENPSWAPDGKHLVFSSNRSGSYQLYTMLANGKNVKQITSQGKNSNPNWSH
ncbi:MAG: Tol-Pal system beta propeller repeat protein TolB [Acidobacteriia bacterium]|nr:Tol-Pal system beta propeller repeat protein TolB [Terriglobia bacterium]